GMGLFALALADEFKTVAGIEFDKAAIDAARLNAKNLGKDNCDFQCGTTEDLLQNTLQNADLNRICLLLDPPRAGCSKQVLSTINHLSSEALAKGDQPSTILYISCNPPRLARDITVLRESGYELQKAIPFDMFPQTSHFEVLAALRRKEETNGRRAL
ncbi:MAG: methyltransferase domain-containing protein, partial [Verrucomicrobia bacterium]|nr:methyltransferase domain-containing protein [Verrucomicrobiota bacterium]